MYSNRRSHLPRPYFMDTLIRRREDPEYVTELSHEIGTTGEVIGDATAEIMITTMGSIPEEMYELDQNDQDNASMIPGPEHTPTVTHDKSADSVSAFAAHSTLFTFLLVALVLLVLICCVSACVIARAKKKYSGSSSDTECDPDCQGSAKQPLISCEKMSESASKSSGTCMRR